MNMAQFELSLLKIKRTMENLIDRTKMAKTKSLPKLVTMTEQHAVYLSEKTKKGEELTEEEVKIVADELIAQMALWAQKTDPHLWNKTQKEKEAEDAIKRLTEQLNQLQYPPKKWWQFWK